MSNFRNFSSDEIRRQARQSQIDHESAMPQLSTSMLRFLDRGDRDFDQTSGILTGGITRRSLFRVGGITVAGAAILAACGSDSKAVSTTSGSTTPAPAASTAGTTAATTADTTAATTAGTTAATTAGTTAAAASGDIVALRTASSVEELAVAAYQIAIDSGLVTTPAVADAAKLFQSQHREHSAFFQAATKKAGGEPFSMPNPAVLEALQPVIKALKDEKGILMLAYDLELAAAQTYQSGVGNVTDLALNKALMSVGGVEARHAAVIASVLGQDPVPLSFGGIDKAIKFGTGVS